MTEAQGGLDLEFFVKRVALLPSVKLKDNQNSLPGSKCYSLVLRFNLLGAAVKKNGELRDQTDKNLLFPPSVLRNTLQGGDVRRMLGCKCTLCVSVTGRDLLADEVLVDAVTGREEQRTLFALLTYMGAGFTARHICSFRTRGWDIPSKKSSLHAELFKPLEQVTRKVFPDSTEITHRFTEIYQKMWDLFDSPIMQIGNHETSFEGANLPFLHDRELNADRGAFGSLHTFEIHHEFRGPKVPALAVRKELPDNNSTIEERRILAFLAHCNKPNFAQFLFWYRINNKVNYVFPKYPGSLHQLLSGQIRLEKNAIHRPKPERYKAKLQHWLWQGMVDVLGAMKFFHFPESKVIQNQLIAAHFDLKPANILVSDHGILLITDFGQARMKVFTPLDRTAMTAQVGDVNYQPPPLKPSPSINAAPGASQNPLGHVEDPGAKWNRAYDIWSMACIMTEVIQYLLDGPAGFLSFRKSRFDEDQSQGVPASYSFWKAVPLREGQFQLKISVVNALRRFRNTQDPYLIMVTDLIQMMFAIEPLQRPSLAHCFGVVSEDIPTDEWPLKDEDEISISGLGANPQLRNMHTQFKRKGEDALERCKMYLLKSTEPNRIRLVLEFDRERVDGDKSTKTACVLSDSARYEEEGLKLLSLFDVNHKPRSFTSHICSFQSLHRSLNFVFDDPLRGPQEYYHFLTALTRQRSLLPQTHMPIAKCTLYTFKGFSTTPVVESYSNGHLQIWKELTGEEYLKEFTYNPQVRRLSLVPTINTNTGGLRSPTDYSLASSSQDSRTMSVSSSSSGSVTQPVTSQKARRLVVFINDLDFPGSAARLLTINLTKGNFVYQRERAQKGQRSPLHFNIRATSARFQIGNFPSDKDCPGVLLDPEILASRERLHVDWVEFEFKDLEGRDGFHRLWDYLYPPDT